MPYKDLEKRRQCHRNSYNKHKHEYNEKVQCECGSFINKKNLSKHIKRKIHADKLAVIHCTDCTTTKS